MLRIAIRGIRREGEHVIVRLAFPEDGERCFEFDTSSGLNLPIAILGTNAEIVDECIDDDAEEWIVCFRLSRT
jgi:hypothetical protein